MLCKWCSCSGRLNGKIYKVGRNSLKQYNPIRPISKVYKTWVLAHKSGYFIDGEIYTGKNAGKVTRDSGGDIVRKLSRLQAGKPQSFFWQLFY